MPHPSPPTTTNTTLSHLISFYTHLTTHIIPGPLTLSYFLPFLLLPLALFIPLSVLSHHQLACTFLPLILACEVHAWAASGGSVDVISITVVLWSVVLLGWRDVRGRFRRVREVVKREEGNGGDTEESVVVVEEEGYPEEWGKRRMMWVGTLLVSLRLTGWKVGEERHDRKQPPKKMGRREFLKVAVGTVLWSYGILDATSWYTRTDPYFFDSMMGVDAPFLAPSSDTSSLLCLIQTLPPRLVRCSVLAGQIYAMVTSMFFIPTLPAVGMNALGLLPDEWSPQTWPVFFGDFSAIGERGMRGLWGSWWHGMNRQITATHGQAVAELLGLSSRSGIGYVILVVLTFFFSGIVHMGMIPPDPKGENLSANTMRLYIASFFWAQVPAFGIEIMASRLSAAMSPNLGWRSTLRVVRLLWAPSWMCLTLPLLSIPFREIGYWRYCAVPISVSRGLCGQGWLTWVK